MEYFMTDLFYDRITFYELYEIADISAYFDASRLRHRRRILMNVSELRIHEKIPGSPMIFILHCLIPSRTNKNEPAYYTIFTEDYAN